MNAAGRFDVEDALDRATGARAIPGNRVSLLCDGPEIFAAMDDMIAGAEAAVIFENYIIRSDEAGWRVAEALAEKARQGVAVRLLYDAVGCRGTSRRYWRFLAERGVVTRRFHPALRSGPVAVLQRDHRKLVAVDQRDAIVGGFCIGNEWAPPGRSGRRPWRDTAVRIAGPAAQVAWQAFRRIWNEAGTPELEAPSSASPEPAGDARVRVVEGLPGRSRVYRALALLAAGVSARLWITDAYFLPPPPLLASLMAAARDDVDVRVLVPGKTDLPILRVFTRVGYRDLLEGGVRLYEWQGSMLHAKSFLLDGGWARVGSSNLNPSSLLGNYELDVLVDDPALVSALAERYRRDLTDAAEIVLEPRRRLPPRVVPGPGEAVAAGWGRRRSLRERRQVAVLTLRQVAAGARRSLLGATVFGLTGIGVLLVALPRLMGWILAGVAFWLAATAVWAGLARRRETRV